MTVTGGQLSARSYHWQHAHIRHGISPHYLDFEHYPLPAKSYAVSSIIPFRQPEKQGGEAPATLAALLFLAYGVTRVRRGQIPFYYRTVPSAGGLYPCHLYLCITSVTEDTETGVYYYNPVRSGLVQLRRGGGCSETFLAQLLTGELALSDVRLMFVVTTQFYNSAWKYRARAYRYLLLDTGHLARNITLNPAIRMLSSKTEVNFDDGELSELLGLNSAAEVPLACVTVNWDKSVSEILVRTSERTIPCFPQESARPSETVYLKDYPELKSIHSAGIPPGLQVPVPETAVADDVPVGSISLAFEGTTPLYEMPGQDLTGCMIRRRSRRNFITRPVAALEYLQLFRCLSHSRDTGLRLGIVCRNLEGIENGFYLLDRGMDVLHLMHRGDLAPLLASVCLDQAWIGQAAMNFLFFSDLAALDTARGPRGYREMMIRAGMLAQQIYLGAEALGFGCCGIGAMYDREASDLLGLSSETALVYAVSAGPVKRQ
jgi:SagB-type dehydrogenase family enzyme